MHPFKDFSEPGPLAFLAVPLLPDLPRPLLRSAEGRHQLGEALPREGAAGRGDDAATLGLVGHRSGGGGPVQVGGAEVRAFKVRRPEVREGHQVVSVVTAVLFPEESTVEVTRAFES